MLPYLSLVKIPLAFWAFIKTGEALTELHLNMRHCLALGGYSYRCGTGHIPRRENALFDKQDKTPIDYPLWVTLSQSRRKPKICGEWPIRRVIDHEALQIKTDKARGITNVFND